jgi:hypothetical protein
MKANRRFTNDILAAIRDDKSLAFGLAASRIAS